MTAQNDTSERPVDAALRELVAESIAHLVDFEATTEDMYEPAAAIVRRVVTEMRSRTDEIEGYSRVAGDKWLHEPNDIREWLTDMGGLP